MVRERIELRGPLELETLRTLPVRWQEWVWELKQWHQVMEPELSGHRTKVRRRCQWHRGRGGKFRQVARERCSERERIRLVGAEE